MISELSVETADSGRINLSATMKLVDPEVYFQGLTLYVDPANPPIVTYGGRQLSVIHNGPDETGRYSISIPFRKKAKIWH